MADRLDISGFYQTVNAAVISAFDLGQYMPLEAFSIFNTKGVNTDRIPKLINRTASNADDSTDLDRQTETELNVDIALDQVLKSWQYVGKDQMNRISPEYAARLGQKIGRAVSEGYSNRLAAILAVTGMTATQTNSFNDESTTLSDWVAVAEDAAQSLDDAKVPAMGRYCLCKPAFFRKIAQTEYYGSRDYRENAASDMQNRSAQSFKANGIEYISWPSQVFTTNTAADTNYESKYRRNFVGDNIYAIMWSDQAIGVKVVEDLNVTVDYVPHKQSNLVVGRTHFGTAAIQSEGIRIIVGDANTT